uniref:Uncharacterized protein n=1 Tax=Arundo donax TaxID=35708 RepID=A0A0A8ZCD1_ARUDO
MMHFIRPNR